MRRMICFVLVLVLALMFFIRCSTASVLSRRDTSREIDIKKLADMINETLRKPSLKNQEIGLLSFANLNNLQVVEPLGRLLQERLSHALFELGFRIVEIRLGDHIYFEPLVGELNLTRLKEKLKDKEEFKGIKSLIVGTYIDAGDYVYVNSKFVELESNIVRASGEIKIKKGAYLSKLLNEDIGNNGNKDVYERFPEKKEEKK
jgi:hypothetical protein